MQRDIQIVPDRQGEIQLRVIGAGEDTGLMLLQRLYVSMLADADDDSYREGEKGYSLLAFLEGGNTPEDGVMDSILSIACAVAVRRLDESDRQLVRSFYGSCENGEITCTLDLADGTTIHGVLSNG